MAKRKRQDGDGDALCQEDGSFQTLFKCTTCAKQFASQSGWAKHVDKDRFCRQRGAQYETMNAAEQAATVARVLHDAECRVSYETEVQEFMVEQYSVLRYQQLLPRSTVDSIKSGIISPLLSMVKEELLKRHPSQDDTPLTFKALVDEIFDVHRGIETCKQETRELKKLVEPVQPVARELIDQPNEQGKATGPRRGEYVYDMPVLGSKTAPGELDSMLRRSPEVLDQLRAAASSWAEKRPNAGQSTFVYADISDGAIMRNHPELGERADRTDGRCAASPFPRSSRVLFQQMFACVSAVCGWRSYYTTTTLRSSIRLVRFMVGISWACSTGHSSIWIQK